MARELMRDLTTELFAEFNEPRSRPHPRRRTARTRRRDAEFETLRLTLARHLTTGATFRACLIAGCLLRLRPLNSEIWRAHYLLRQQVPTKVILATILAYVPGVSVALRGFRPLPPSHDEMTSDNLAADGF